MPHLWKWPPGTVPELVPHSMSANSRYTRRSSTDSSIMRCGMIMWSTHDEMNLPLAWAFLSIGSNAFDTLFLIKMATIGGCVMQGNTSQIGSLTVVFFFGIFMMRRSFYSRGVLSDIQKLTSCGLKALEMKLRFTVIILG